MYSMNNNVKDDINYDEYINRYNYNNNNKNKNDKSEIENYNCDLSDRLRILLTQQKYTDCTFKIDGITINCHKIILSSASPVFEAMFYGPLAEKQSIEIIDIAPEIFQIMIEFIYTDDINLLDLEPNIEHLLELYYCAEKYLITKLIDKCTKLICKILQQHNILKAMDLVVSMDLKPLLNICITFFMKYILNSLNYLNVIRQNDYHISGKCLKYIIDCIINKNDKLTMHILYLIKRWCNNEIKITGRSESEMLFILNDMKISQDLINTINNINFVDNFSCYNKWLICQRTYYKAMHPLHIGKYDMSFKTSLTTNRDIILKSLSLNSRLPSSTLAIESIQFSLHQEQSQQYPTAAAAAVLKQNWLSCQYTENILVKIQRPATTTTISTPSDYYHENFVIFNTEYNSNVRLIFENPITLIPHQLYIIDIIWDNKSFGCEYPQSIFSLDETTNFCTLKFDKHLNYDLLNERGSILNGIEYSLV